MSQLVTYNALVGYVLEQRRVELGYDQGYVAGAAGMSQPVLSRLEKGKASITVDQLFVLAQVLNMAPEQIIKKAHEFAHTFGETEGIDVTTGKQSEAIGKSGSPAKAVLAGAAIGAVLGLLLSRS